MSELKPCPFCGGRSIAANPGGRRWIQCTECWATSKRFGEESEAIAAWNQRPEGGEPVGYITEADLRRIKSDDPFTHSVNVWRSQDEGDHAIYLAAPSGEMERDNQSRNWRQGFRAGWWRRGEELALGVPTHRRNELEDTDCPYAILASGEGEG